MVAIVIRTHYFAAGPRVKVGKKLGGGGGGLSCTVHNSAFDFTFQPYSTTKLMWQPS